MPQADTGQPPGPAPLKTIFGSFTISSLVSLLKRFFVETPDAKNPPTLSLWGLYEYTHEAFQPRPYHPTLNPDAHRYDKGLKLKRCAPKELKGSKFSIIQD